MQALIISHECFIKVAESDGRPSHALDFARMELNQYKELLK